MKKDIKKKTNLEFVLKKTVKKTEWDYKKYKRLVNYLKIGYAKSTVAKKLNIKEVTLNSKILELKKAAKKGWSLEEYSNKKFPFKNGGVC